MATTSAISAMTVTMAMTSHRTYSRAEREGYPCPFGTHSTHHVLFLSLVGSMGIHLNLSQREWVVKASAFLSAEYMIGPDDVKSTYLPDPNGPSNPS
jgi:hypothetical protein